MEILSNIAEIKDLTEKRGGKAVVVSDKNTHRFCVNKVIPFIIGDYYEFVFEGGEENKSLSTVEKLYAFLTEKNVDRSDYIVAVGGGIVTDIAGFVAMTYKRGCGFISVPTSLMAMVDAAFGGKNGFNFCGIKNLAGGFYTPEAIICDVDFLSTLPTDEIQNGLCELIKYELLTNEAVASDFPLELINDKLKQTLLDNSSINIDNSIDVYKIETRILSVTDNIRSKTCKADAYKAVYERASEVIKKAYSYKMQVVENDLFDNGVRHLLNFGHTVGHTVEEITGNRVPHGIAVALGMLAELKIAEFFGKKAEKKLERLSYLLERFSLRLVSVDLSKCAALISADKKKNGEYIKIPFVTDYGNEICSVKLSEFAEALQNV